MKTLSPPVSLSSYLERNRDHVLWIDKTVPLSAVGALTAQAKKTVVFNRVQGQTMPIVDLLFHDRAAQARVLGCESTDVLPALNRVLRAGPKPLRVVEQAPCKERVYLGDDIDLGMLPVVTHTDRDPYPYTTSFVVHRDPVTRTYNSMFPRCGVLSRNTMVTSFVTPTAIRILGQHREAKSRMPQALVIGAHPVWELAAAYNYAHEGWWELELFESITGQVGEVVKCETNDLLVPADASIVVEGYLDPVETAIDGPSPGPTIIFSPYASQQPVFHVTAITMRNDPIYRNHMETPFTDHQELPRLWQEALLFDRIKAMNVGLVDLAYPQGGGALALVIQLDPSHAGQATDAILTAMGSFINTKLVIAVDPDIDMWDYREILYALATRVDPTQDLIVIPNTRGWIFDPRATPEIGALPNTAESRFPSSASRWGINATKPPRYKAERKDYDRALPIGYGTIRLEDYL